MAKRFFLIMSALAFFCSVAQAENWSRSGSIVEKNWIDGSPYVFGDLIDPPSNDNYCDEGDKALMFDVRIIYDIAGESFDVNNFYVDGLSTGEWALNILQEEYWRHGDGHGWAVL